MSDYINREVAINAVFEAIADGRAVFPTLNNIPAADVRPVVYCKDCKHAERVGMADGCVWCNENLLARLDDDFCSRGADMREER